MVDQELTFYNSYFDKIEGIGLLNGFLYDGEANSYGGRISLKRANSTIEFEVLIPGDYPFREIAFKCTDLNGYPHQNFDGTVCLNTPFVNHIYTRLGLDIEKLKGWVQKYVENEETDEHYEYMPGDCSGKIDFLFQEGEFDPNRFSQKVFGDMSFSILNAHFKEQKIERTSIICQNIGNKEITWASRYKKYEKYKGIWAYIDKEPVLARKLRIENWQDLIPLLPHDFLSFFETFRKKTGNYKLGPKTFQNKIFIALGYSIPSTSGGKEITWDLILLPADTFPKKDCTNALKLRRLDQKINWERTSNCDFQRFFGRGALSDKMKSSKVLILGVGAIGSSIAETLVRGGLKLLSINDNDTVESGNICRSVFSFTNIGCGKAAELKGRLEQISPFVEVDITEAITPCSNKSSTYEQLKQRLNEFDIIFDCSANNGIIEMLSEMNLNNQIFYISITNKAKEMLCISSADCRSMVERRNQMMYALDAIQEAAFREGTGCWHPTFEASFFDINQLLHFTIRKINTFFVKNSPPKSFYSYFRNDTIASSEDIRFVQKEKGLFITIESVCLDKIFNIIRHHWPKEFGGIFIGNYINDFKEVVISDIITPRNYQNSYAGFKPDHIDLNKQLKDVYSKFSGEMVYIGDWHSHPNGTNQYSQDDYHSIKSVAISSNVNTHNPILMIAAFGKDYFSPGFYVFHDDKLLMYELVQ